MNSAGSYAVWCVLGVAGLGLWVRSLGSTAVARPSEVVRRLATGPLGRIAFLVVLVFAGWHLFAR